MIEHCVWVKFRPEISQEDRQALFRRLAGVTDQVPGMRALRWGRNAGYEALDQGFGEGFVAVFDDAKALALYQSHSEHQAAGRDLVASAVGGLQGILVFDLETP